ncbi:hypothetical protein [Blautia faecis]
MWATICRSFRPDEGVTADCDN